MESQKSTRLCGCFYPKIAVFVSITIERKSELFGLRGQETEIAKEISGYNTVVWWGEKEQGNHNFCRRTGSFGWIFFNRAE